MASDRRNCWASVLFSSYWLIFLLVKVEAVPNPGIMSEVPICPPNDFCTCSSRSVVERFDEILHKAAQLSRREPNAAIQNIQRFSCELYVKLPHYLTIQMPTSVNSLDFRLRRRYRNKRSVYGYETAADNDFNQVRTRSRRQLPIGQGLLTPEQVDTLAVQVPQSSSHLYKALGWPVTLPCFTDEEELYGAIKYDWTHLNGRPITAALVRADNTNGELIFESVRLADTGIYVCTATYDDGYTTESKEFRTQLDVIAAPMMWLTTGITYETDRCRHKELLLIQNSIPDWVKDYVCHFCPVRNVSVTCGAEIEGQRGSKDGPRYVQITMALSTVGLESMLPSWNHQSQHCNVKCIETMHLKALNFKLYQKVGKNLFTHQFLPVGIITKRWVVRLVSIITINFAVRLSFPCTAGKYSPHGKAECSLCEEGFFQPNPGSSACFPCPKDHSTLQEGSVTQAQCVLESFRNSLTFARFHWVIVLSGLGVLLLLILILVVCCCCPNSCLGKCLTCKCCGDNSKDEHHGSRERLIMDNISDYEEPSHIHTEERDIKTVHHYGRPRRHSNKNKPTFYDQQRDHDENTRFHAAREHNHTVYREQKETRVVTQDVDVPNSKRTQHNFSSPHVQSLVRKAEGHHQLRSPSVEHAPLIIQRSFHETRTVKPQPSRREMRTPPPLSPEQSYISVNEKQFENHRSRTHLRKQEAPSLPKSRPNFKNPNSGRSSGTESERSNKTCGVKYCKRDPNIKLGNILNQSKSLAQRLAEVRAKLGTRDRTPSRSRWKFKNKPFKADPSVCKECSSSHFKSVNERMKHFR
ncbi:Signal peptide, CUB and EGF-like domain-containing protein 2 [Orchesella cincta]|uniref:Signal peptide, CUB and EGF-like domain-containing protein 2 n=1 Tax=Orchesella cincta TaxID=48709 RepID=A0A1D2N3G8_ORCCI|nr:Signal peptide, CUB and EGF-like domain-containing protein 2 [Orchesella cincta]